MRRIMNSKRSFESYIREVRALGPGTTRKISNADVEGSIPPRFKSTSRTPEYPLALGYYRENITGNAVFIAKHIGAYTIGVEDRQSHDTISFGSQSQNHTPASSGSSTRKLMAGGLCLVGAALAAVAFGGSSSEDLASTQTETSSPQQPTTAPRQSDYQLFISHAWDYSDEYERLCRLLNDVDGFSWRNFSVPETDPKDVQTSAELTAALVNQIRPASTVVVSAGMYTSHRKWIQKEIRIADELDKPIIGVKPHGNQRWPKVVKNSATRTVNWNGASVASAIAEAVDE